MQTENDIFCEFYKKVFDFYLFYDIIAAELRFGAFASSQSLRCVSTSLKNGISPSVASVITVPKGVYPVRFLWAKLG